MRIEDYCEIIDGSLTLRHQLQDHIRHGILTIDESMNRQLDMLERLGTSDLPLTIKGEIGSGKDRIARYAHDVSSRKNKPFQTINCSYYPDVQTAIRLFGNNGLLHQTAGGSLYIANIDILSSQTQRQLWEYISSPEGKRENVRLMVCLSESNHNRNYTLIEPLSDYFASVEFYIPPLRERKADILLLTMQQLQYIQTQYRVARNISPEVMSAMLSYAWPGNIRQLIKITDRMAFMSDDTLMDSVNLLKNCLSTYKDPQLQASEPEDLKPKSLKELVSEYEIRIINQYIERYGSIRKAATALDISHSALSNKLMKYYASTSAKTK